MTGKIVKLGPPPTPDDVEWLIATLKRHLRTGQVQALAFAVVLPGGNIAHGCAGGSSGHQHALAAGSALIHRAVMRGYE